uniref:Ras GTPase-activating protein n=1 Tax=Globodera rostochiensis TaxID=31243 RepID=A0A914GYI5_GLORO
MFLQLPLDFAHDDSVIVDFEFVRFPHRHSKFLSVRGFSSGIYSKHKLFLGAPSLEMELIVALLERQEILEMRGAGDGRPTAKLPKGVISDFAPGLSSPKYFAPKSTESTDFFKSSIGAECATMSAPPWHPLSLLGAILSVLRWLCQWTVRRVCCCSSRDDKMSSVGHGEEGRRGQCRRSPLPLHGLGELTDPLLANLDQPLQLHTPPDDEENVSATELDGSAGDRGIGRGETRSLDRHFVTWQGRRHNETTQLARDISSPGVALLDPSSLHNSTVSASQRFANFLSRRLKRTKSFPKLTRTRDNNNNNQRGSDHQLVAVSVPAEGVAMRDILGESALRTDEEWGGRVKSMISQAPLSLHMNGVNARGNAFVHRHSALSLRPSRSHESLLLLNAGQQQPLAKSPSESHQQDLLLRRLQPVHASISPDNCCFLLDNNVYSCRTSDERSRWMDSVRRRMNPKIDRVHRVENCLAIWVLEAKGVPAKRRFFCELSLDGQLKARTSTKGMSDGICFWGESFEFGSLPPARRLCIDLFREADTKKTASTRRARGGAEREDRHTLIGLVNIPLTELAGRQPVEKWYSVSSNDPNANSNNSNNPANANGADSLPSIRVKARYQSVHILPLRAYKPLREYLRLHFLPFCATFEPILGVKAKEDFACALVRVLQHERRAAEALADLAMVEVDGQENDHLLFRGNSLATKAVEAYMKLVASDFLQSVLGDFVHHLLAANLNCEVDPLRLLSPSASSLERNRHQLTKKVEEAWSRIRHSADHFPHPLRSLFSTVRRQLELSGRAELADNLLSSCIFLRFLCPAILSPSLFGLASEYPTGIAARNLTLVAKSLQTLANFTRFGGKESYMEFMNGFVEREWRNMQCFLRKISAPSPASEFDEDCLRAIRSNVDLGKELSLLHCYLSEAWTPKLGANNTISSGTSSIALREVLMAVNRKGGEDEAEEDEQHSAHNNPPSDYENNSMSMMCCNGRGSCGSPTEMKCHVKSCVVLPPKQPFVNVKQYPHQQMNNILPQNNLVPAPFSSPNSVTSNHLDSADDYVLSSALAQLQGHSQQKCQPTTTVHVYDETPRGGGVIEHHLYDEVAMDGTEPPADDHHRLKHQQQNRMIKMKMSVTSSVVNPSQRAVAASCTPRVIQKCHQLRKPSIGERNEVAEDEDEAAGSDSTEEEEMAFSNSSVEIFHQRRAMAQRKKSLGASSADSSTAPTLLAELMAAVWADGAQLGRRQ